MTLPPGSVMYGQQDGEIALDNEGVFASHMLINAHDE